MTDFKALREQKELIKMREASMYSWRQELEEEKKEDSKPCEKCGKDPCECEDKKGKKAGKHPFVEVMPTSKDGLKENTRLSLKPNTQFHLDEIYKGKHGQSEKEYQDSRSDAGKMISGDSKGSGANYSYRAKNTGTNPAGGKEKPQGQARMASKDREYLKYRKSSMKKEELSIDDQMRISREAAKGRNPNPDHRAIRAKQLKNTKSPKDTRTDAQKMADATGPRKGSNYRGD